MAQRYIVPDTCAIAAALYRKSFSLNVDPLINAIRNRTVDAVAPVVGIAEFLNVSRKKIEGYKTGGQQYPPLNQGIVDSAIQVFFSLPIVWIDINRNLALRSWHTYLNEGIQTGDAFFLEIAREFSAEIWTTDEPFYQKTQPFYGNVYNLRSMTFA